MDYKTLSDGVKMPILGLGAYQVPDPDERERMVSDAILVGYCSIDTAQAYTNEETVGDVVRKSGIVHEKFLIITKIWTSNYGYERAKASLGAPLAKLQTDYIDLVFLHQPFGDYYSVYCAMEEYYKAGRTKVIGISNFASNRVADLATFADVIPVVNQAETYVFDQRLNARRAAGEYGVQIESQRPSVEGRNDFFINETLIVTGQKYHKSAVQVALRYLIQCDVIATPKTAHKNRMEQNFGVFDFVLTDDDMTGILKLDTGENQFFSHADPETIKMISSFKI